MEMTETISNIMNIVVDKVLIPALLVIGSTILILIKGYAEKLTNSLITKNETECLTAITTAKNNLIKEVDSVVSAAVSNNMALATDLRSQHNGLTSVDVKQLNSSAKQMIQDSLPESLINDNGSLSKIMGGQKSLNALIEGLIEKHVIAQKHLMK